MLYVCSEFSKLLLLEQEPGNSFLFSEYWRRSFDFAFRIKYSRGTIRTATFICRALFYISDIFHCGPPPNLVFVCVQNNTAEFIYMEQFCLKVRITYDSNIVLLFTSYITRVEKNPKFMFFLIVTFRYV